MTSTRDMPLSLQYRYSRPQAISQTQFGLQAKQMYLFLTAKATTDFKRLRKTN